jgi:glycosyltransferase family protein
MTFESTMRRFKLRMKKRMYKLNKKRWLSENQQDLEAFEQKLLYSMPQTLKLVAQGKSLARFGDGEITLMDGDDIDFQKSEPELALELESILKNKDEKLLVCLPTMLTACNDDEVNWWLKFWYVRWKDLKQKLSLEHPYGHSMVTRPDFFIMYPEQAVQAWKSIWHNRNTVLITGEGSKLNLEHMLFDNVSALQVIYSKATNAYTDVDRIIAEVQNTAEPNSLILIALGPTGTVLAKLFSDIGYQALDIGHITSSYDAAFSRKLFD